MIHHGLVASSIEASPRNQMGRVRGIAVPLIRYQELLSHEELRNAWSGQQQPGGKSRAAAGIPGAGVRAVRESGNARVAAGLHHGVIFHAGYCLPCVWKVRGEKIGGDRVEVHGSTLAFGSLLNGGAERDAQSIVLQNVETGPAAGCGSDDRGTWLRVLGGPILGVLQQTGLEEAQGVGEI